jgi:organic hydroperoxide reductase OsmC/OhrA
MKGQHQYKLKIKWTGNSGRGTSGYREYDRSHSILVENKVEIHGSSDPAFLGDKSKHNPEELLLASLASCHMLWYLHLCSEAGVIVIDYVDSAKGIMIENQDGGGRFTEVTLHPVVTVSQISMLDKANELHNRAHELCFIANSVNFPVRHKAEIIVDN